MNVKTFVAVALFFPLGVSPGAAVLWDGMSLSATGPAGCPDEA